MKFNLLSYKYFRTASAWIIFILGVALYIVGYFIIKDQSICKEIVIKVADVLVIGVILGYLSNASQFLGVFKQDLQDIIYGKDFIKKRKDIYPLWETLSKEMFKNKFPIIHKDFLKLISNYFPNDEISYYDDYERNMSITWENREKGIIKVTEEVSFNIIAETADSFLFPIKTWTQVDDKTSYSSKITEFIVKGRIIELGNESVTRINNEVCQEYKVPLAGSTKYEIQYTREKVYNINHDYYIGFRANYIVNKLRVSLELPDDLDALFTCRGTQDDFENVRNTGKKRRIEKKYKGIILPRQGYLFSLRQLNN